MDGAMKFLRFEVLGGHGSVKLYQGKDLVRRSFGPYSKKKPRQVRWTLEPFQGKVIRLVIEDKHEDPWGFLTVKGFHIDSE